MTHSAPTRQDPRDAVRELAATANDTSLPTARRVAAAAQLWHLAETARAAVEPFKEELRAMAVAQSGGQKGPVQFPGEGVTQARVVIPAMGVELESPPELAAARAELGEDFDRVYRVGLTLVPRTPEDVSALPARARAHLASRVRLARGKPRVTLESLTGVSFP